MQRLLHTLKIYKFPMSRVLLILLFFSLFVNILFSGIKIVKIKRSEEYIRKTNKLNIKETEQIIWISEDKIVEINGSIRTIILHKKKKVIIIDDKKREILSLSFPLFYSRLLPKQLMPVKFNEFPKVKVKELNINDMVGSYKCKLYKLTLNFLMMTIKITIWTSPDPIKDNYLNVPEKNYFKNLQTNSLLTIYYPNLPSEELSKKRGFYNSLKKIKGIWVKSEMSIDLLIRRYKITETVKKIVKSKIPENLLIIPNDYKKITDLQN